MLLTRTVHTSFRSTIRAVSHSTNLAPTLLDLARKMSSSAATDSTTRFTTRTADYVSSRPSYPAEIFSAITAHFSLLRPAPSSSPVTIADLGSGTGISSLALQSHLSARLPADSALRIRILGIEPNDAMRAAAADQAAAAHTAGAAPDPRVEFTSHPGTAEATGLADRSVDLVLAGQAFHWFDVGAARREVLRVLRPAATSGAALVWNERRGMDATSSPSAAEARTKEGPRDFMEAYEALLLRRLGERYTSVAHTTTVTPAVLRRFFTGREEGEGGFETLAVTNASRLDFEQIKGRCFSSSYTPEKGEEGYEEMAEELRELFERYKGEDGLIEFVYDCRVHYGAVVE